jgi:hypothetical protein
MARIQWARGSQFNWAYDNMGGTPLQEAAAGKASGATASVAVDGSVIIQEPNPGGGQVHFLRGVWLKDTLFAWDGFWAAAIDGDLTNYYEGGSFVNEGSATVITLGTPLAPGTEVQLFYIYFTGDQAAKYEALNNYPCIRRACRGRDDYTYDFAVDRLLDLMVYLHQAEKERGLDYGPARRFLWQALAERQHSLTPPLVYDSFERQLWERGAFLLYQDSTRGAEGLPVFQTELAEGSRERVLHVKADLPTVADGAWFGYGLDWSLTESPFSDIDRVSLKLMGRGHSSRLHNLTKYGSGSAQLLFAGDYEHQEKRRFVVMVETGGEVGVAIFKWSKDGGLTWEAEGLITGDRDHPVALMGGIEVYWEGGTGDDFAAGDYWTFWGGEPEEHPRRLLVCLNDSSPGDANPWGPTHTYVHALPDRFTELTAWEIPFSQFWRRDNIIDDGDRVRATWGTWYSASQPDDSQLTICDREGSEALFGDTYYTQRQITWDLSQYATAFGAWAGIDTARCNSSGRTAVNILIKPEVSGLSSLTLRVKVKDANGSYFYEDREVQVNSWQRVSVDLAGMALESGVPPLTHPIQVVDIGIPASPPSNGAFYVSDLKFDERVRFTGAQRLRLLEFKIDQQGLREHEWWLDEVGLNLIATDPYPYVPRLAVSLTPYGQNPWRGPTLVHYAQPLGPYLAGALDLAETYIEHHRDAQDEFAARYGGVKGPILPVHTRNDLENIALCGEENFGKFCWWSRYRDYGKVSGVWHFNEALTDASGNGHTLWWSGGSPVFVEGVCQPGLTAISFDGTAHASLGSNPLFEPGAEPFAVTLIIKGPAATGWQWVVDKMGSDGWVIQTKGAGSRDLQMKVTTSAGDSYADIQEVLDGGWHMVTWMAVPADGKIYKIKDNALLGSDNLAIGNGLNNTAYLNIGASAVFTLDYFRYERRVLPAPEYESAWDMARGLQNGSAYPEAGSGLAQYWAFYRMAQYFFVTGDSAALDILANWLTWIDAYGIPEGNGWKLPLWFSAYGFQYGDYDPGAAASVALGCLFIHLRNGNETAATWARRILDDLRQNRQSTEFGGGYKSDYHYAWLNALAAQAFGVAAFGLAGQAYRFPGIPEDKAHFEALLTWIFAHAGDAKPNLLNADLIPFSYMEAEDLWDYAPHYLFMREMGSLEALVLMAGAALTHGKASGDWSWFDTLVRFVLADHRLPLRASQLRSLTASHQLAEGKNVVRVFFADYDRDNGKYCEARDEAALSEWGEAALDLDCRYGSPVILENPEVARLLAERLLERLSTRWDTTHLETWLEGARAEVGDILAATSDFHDLEQEEFTVFGKAVDLKRRRVRFDLARPALWTWAWAVDAAAGDYEAYAIDQASAYDENWAYRAYAF